jgi:hypothetical protein
MILEECRNMGERLKLFGVQHSAEDNAAFGNHSPEWKKATAYVAWGIYNWLT